ncbi:MAG: circadian clock protein KaiC [Euryarchaeota archaeon]|nr:circadian clock protein KaiC [Euryarchaeota archaeon]
MVEKVKSGIIGLDPLLDGGLNKNSSTVIIGSTGAGKTTFATQFIRRGLLEGSECIFISLDENKEQIIRDAVDMGWDDILYFIQEEKLVFVDASGKEFGAFIKKELPDFVASWTGSNTRVAIDPLTPVIWANPARYAQRELLAFMLKELRKVGTLVATLEEHGPPDLTAPETVIPMYLADSVIHLRYRTGENKSRMLKVVKMRGSRHSEYYHMYRIIPGLGMVVIRSSELRKSTTRRVKELERLINARSRKLSPVAQVRIKKMLKSMEDGDIEGLDLEALAESIVEAFI